LKRSLYEWANFDRAIHAVVLLGFFFAIMFSIFSCEDIRVGKTREEINRDLSRTMFEVDSILNQIQYQIDSASVDGTYYINMQRINR
jgi:hypothetical protein